MLETHENPLRALTDPLSGAMFRRPSRIGVESAWYGHVPFAMWLMEQMRPRVFVELGTHTGVSYAAFCDSVLEHRLATRCFAVDTWEGDVHAGFYDEGVYQEFRRFHDPRYQAFSRLLRMTFDDARQQMADGSIDLLHIDGLHSYEAVRHDFEGWLGKLTDQAVVLFHDTNVRERGFGVWRLWRDLCQSYPGFEFPHCNGLGVLAVGRNVPASIETLCTFGDHPGATEIRNRFALIGERWEAEARLLVLQAEIRRLVADATARNEVEWRTAEAARNELIADLAASLADLQQTRTDLAAQEHQRAVLEQERAVLLNSTVWRVTAPLRRASGLVPVTARRILRGVIAAVVNPLRGATDPRPEAAVAEPSPAPAVPATMTDRAETAAPKLVFVSGESDTPGHIYRIEHYADAAITLGAEVTQMTPADVAQHGKTLGSADVVVLWRTARSPEIDAVIAATRTGRAKLVFDVDDLMVKPELAETNAIDAIRSQHLAPADVAGHYQRVRDVAVKADICTTTTEPLARHLRELQKIAFVLPNGFDQQTVARSRRAVRERRARSDDGLVRIGYAAGTRTHQRDFAVAADAVARILHDHPACRLVLFRDQAHGHPMLDVLEFPSLAAQADRIEWRDTVSLAELPNELARFDINLAPLEIGNPYCEAKSELKYFEAALADVCTVASATEPMASAIRHRETGMLADSSEAWYEVLKLLVGDSELRGQLARAAYLDVLWRYGPRQRAESVKSLLDQVAGGHEAARGFELQLRQRYAPRTRSPELAPADIVFSADALGIAEVSVIIPLYNYADYITDALESVRAQSVQPIDLIIVDDCSTDDSLRVARSWAEQQAQTGRFNRIVLLCNRVNQGLARTRNVGFDAAETEFVVPLDADNRLLPDFCARTLQSLRGTSAAFAYTKIQCFGSKDHVIGLDDFSPGRFVHSNYIDAMALVAKDAWAAVGGYTHIQHGWEDYDFWCCCVEHGIWGVHVPEILAEYRFHEKSMLRTVTEITDNKLQIIRELESRHPWLSIGDRE